MKKNIWKQLKKQNDGRQLNLEVPDQKYIDKVTAYAINQGVGMMETEIIRKDLIGMGFEAKKEGELLEQRLGDVGEFARELVDAGKAENRKEEKYYFMKSVGLWYLVLAFSALLLVLFMNTLELLRGQMNLGGFVYAFDIIPMDYFFVGSAYPWQICPEKMVLCTICHSCSFYDLGKQYLRNHCPWISYENNGKIHTILESKNF